MAGAALDPSALLPRPTLPIGSKGAGTDGRSYELLAIIERGGMGELFLARMTRAGLKPQYAVLKRLLADLLDDDKYIQMFKSEAQVMSELDHPNIVRVIDMPRIGGTQCLAMEYVRGRNVQQMLARCMDLGTHIPPEIVLGIMIEVMRGLDYAHNYKMKDGTSLELVHRDVTPGNVLVAFDGDVKLTDFGIAKSKMSMVQTTVGIVKGKARYLSPEQILGEAATARSDIFSSAAVVCEMLTGVPAFDRGSVPKTLYAIVNGEMPDLERTLPFRAPMLMETLHHALATRPDERMPSAKVFAEALESAAKIFGPLVSRGDIGWYVSKLFEGTPDPLAPFFEEAEAVTVHGPPPRLPSFHPNGRQRADSVHEEEEPTNQLTGPPPPIVKGTPVEPPQPKPTPAVDEALSALAMLQSQSGERIKSDALNLKEIAEEAARAESPPPPQDDMRVTSPAAPAYLPKIDKRTLLVFGAGALAGILATVTVQAIFSDSEPEEETELVLEAVEAKAEEADEEPVVEEPLGVEEPKLAEVSPPPAPPPAPRLASLDILYPRGARARIDGKLMNSRVPIRGIRLSAGHHSVRVWKGKYRREIRFEARGGARYVMTQKLTKR